VPSGRPVTNGSYSRAAMVAGMPAPRSATSTSGPGRTHTSTVPPSGEASIALRTRLSNTWRTADGDATVVTPSAAWTSIRMSRRSAVGSSRAAVARAAAPPPPTVPTYATASACVSCHTKQMSRWALTDHARAWESLLARQSTQNPECVGCHSTGFGEPGGFGDPAAASALRFKAVQCEACHGPMAGHPDDGKKPPAVTIDTCTGCHDAANSPEFAFGRYLQRATCQSR